MGWDLPTKDRDLVVREGGVCESGQEHFEDRWVKSRPQEVDDRRSRG